VIALVIIVAAVVVFVGAIWFIKKPGSAPIEQLVRACYGDREMAERLLARERERHPQRDERKLVQTALERLLEDRRR
jgi:hypothetical protein